MNAWKRSQTAPNEIMNACTDFISQRNQAHTPFFVWLDLTSRQIKVDVTAPVGAVPTIRPFGDVVLDHDQKVGQLLKILDEIGIAGNTIIMYSAASGPQVSSQPNGPTTPFRYGEYRRGEGAFRVPLVIRWPSRISAGSVCNAIVHHEDWLPTLVGAAGDMDIAQKLRIGYDTAQGTFKVHIGGNNLLPFITDEVDIGPRSGLVYISSELDVLGLRYADWKTVFRSGLKLSPADDAENANAVPDELTIFDLRADPFEHANISVDRILMSTILANTNGPLTRFISTFKEFPPRSEAASFSIDHAVEALRSYR
jgi:arylsulfatase A-like enzyme